MARGKKNQEDLKSESIPFARKQVAQQLLAWYGNEGRDLPWRKTRDPYRIWLSEIMLQQTTVAAVIPYYERFLQRFPSLESLASAPLDDVINLWAGLGYYSRARNLHKAARKVKVEYAGVFPDSIAELMALPGIGRSTAGAILSIAFDLPAPILDGNVRRVLVRLFAWQEDPRSSKAEKQLWKWAEKLTPDDAPHDYAQAIMDLGATVCTPRNPGCERCPLKDLCQAFAEGHVESLPVSRKKKPLPVRRQVCLLIERDRRLLLRQRPAEGFLGGLWEFPTVDLNGKSSAAEALRLLNDHGMSSSLVHVADVSHTYSHFRLELSVYKASPDNLSVVSENQGCRWVTPGQIEEMALHGAHKKALAAANLI